MKVKITQTTDKDLLADIINQLKINDNHCPCMLSQTKETKCMCKAFKDIINSNIPGEYECTCGRYIATIQND